MTSANRDRSVAIVSLSGAHGGSDARRGGFETVRYVSLPDGDALDPLAARLAAADLAQQAGCGWMIALQAGEAAADLMKDSNTASFAIDVLDASAKVPVIVDFWAPWCGPCKQLGPMIEKLVRQAGGLVRLVKINIDENQDLAAQLQIQSIPAVFAFKDGRPVDGFAGAQPESQIRAFINRLTGTAKAPPSSPASCLWRTGIRSSATLR